MMLSPTSRLRRWVLVLLAALAAGSSAWAADKWGVLVMHGKNPGSAKDPSTDSLITKLQAVGAVTLKPDMPWSRTRYIDKSFDGALAEIDGHVQSLRAQGATRIALAGHSMGCPAALAYAARKGGVDALLLLAPGHVPYYYYRSPPLAPVRESIDQARDMVSKGQGEQVNTPFTDINQGKRITVFTSPQVFLSYFDPLGDAEMSVTAPQVPPTTAVLWVIGRSDPLYASGRAYVFDKLPPHPKSLYLEVDANHLTTPGVAADAAVQWLTGQ